MTTREKFTIEEAREIAGNLDIDYTNGPFNLEQFRMGLDVELEHGTRDSETDVTGDDPLLTGKIALAHLRELPDYYTRLAVMEGEVDTSSASTVRSTRASRPDTSTEPHSTSTIRRFR